MFTYPCYVNLHVADLPFPFPGKKIQSLGWQVPHFTAYLAGKMAVVALVGGIHSFPIAGVGMQLPLFNPVLEKAIYGGNADIFRLCFCVNLVSTEKRRHSIYCYQQYAFLLCFPYHTAGVLSVMMNCCGDMNA